MLLCRVQWKNEFDAFCQPILRVLSFCLMTRAAGRRRRRWRRRWWWRRRIYFFTTRGGGREGDFFQQATWCHTESWVLSPICIMSGIARANNYGLFSTSSSDGILVIPAYAGIYINMALHTCLVCFLSHTYHVQSRRGTCYRIKLWLEIWTF